jgi:ABC-type lipoprotein export system ATPase subunit
VNELLRCIDVHKSFGSVDVVRGVNLALPAGSFSAIMGRSGSGKTTLLHLISALEAPTSGSLLFEGEEISALSEDRLALWRRQHIGLVFQAFHLIPTLSALENVAFPLYPMKIPAEERRARARVRLQQMGLEHRLEHRPSRLSGGEQQRVAIARALINRPTLILADEPTGNLDKKNGEEILALFKRLNEEEGVAIIVVTHDSDVAAVAKHRFTMVDGTLKDGSV